MNEEPLLSAEAGHDCPECGAPAGQMCRYPAPGPNHVRMVCRVRIAVWQTANGQPVTV